MRCGVRCVFALFPAAGASVWLDTMHPGCTAQLEPSAAPSGVCQVREWLRFAGHPSSKKFLWGVLDLCHGVSFSLLNVTLVNVDVTCK